MRMRRTTLALLLVAGLAWAGPAAAVTISILPGDVVAASGSSFDVDVVVSGLGAAGAPSLGAFDIDILFDDALLDLTAVAFGPGLGDPALLEALTSVTVAGGVADLGEVSLLLPGELDALQGPSLVAATLSFEVIGSGDGSIDVGDSLLSDAFAQQLVVTDTSGARVSSAVVPEPTAALVFAIGVGVIAVGARRRTV